MNEVVHFIESENDWKIKYINDSGVTPPNEPSSVNIGVKSIRVLIGQYRSISDLYSTTSVTAFYAFNESDELINIWVWKDTDSV